MVSQSSVFGNKEIILVAESIAHEKGISAESIILAIENGISLAAKKQYGENLDIECNIERKSGKISLYNKIKIIEDESEDQNYGTCIEISKALKKDPKAKIDDFIKEQLPPIPLKRIIAGAAKSEIIKQIKKAEKVKEYNRFKDRIGEIVYVSVKKIGLKNILMDVEGFEGIIHKKDLIPGESLKVGDKTRVYIEDVRQEENGAQIFLSRTHPQFLVKLFAQEVPELYEGNIEVKSVARDPGSRSKIAIFSKREDVDIIGSFIGIRGNRVQAVSTELRGEKIDIIKWTPDTPTMLINALAPAKIDKVIIDEEKNLIEVVVNEDQLSLTIGRGGQNVILASKLTGYRIDILTNEEEEARRSEEIKKTSEFFIKALDVEEAIANLLASDGFITAEDLLQADISEISAIEGFDDDLATAVKDRVVEYLKNNQDS